ncbi:MAG: TonB-dependent receptor [Chloracidobacterium sp.]|nr:TonB-dependent receptor [Chloracidobacterium sp.]
MLVGARATFAQGYARITGVVTDPSGAAVRGATITVTQLGTGEGATAMTNDEGLFVFPSLRPTQYDLKVTASGFATFTKTGIILQADAAVTLNVGLQVGGVDQIVTVEASTAQVDTSSATLSQVVDQRRINDLPLNGRNAAALTTLVAGVVIAPNAQADQGLTKTFPVAVTITSNGTRANQTNYMLDGGNNVDPYTNVNAPFPFPDALQEFSVQTSNYSAEYGQNAGGVVNIVTRSGAKDFHGDLFEYNRNALFNASNFFSNPGGAVDPLKRNQFGGTIGGPVKLPRVSTPHSYFFAGYQRTVLRNSPLAGSAAIVPTKAQLAGQFAVANEGQCIKNPFTGAPYPCTAIGNSPGISAIDPSTFDPAAVALTKYLPDGGSSGSVTFRRPTRQNLDEFVSRFDQEIGARDDLSVRYFYDRFYNGGVLDLTNLLTYADQAQIGYHNALISQTHTFSDRLLNNFLIGYMQDNADRGPLAGGVSVTDLGVKIWNPAFKQINQIQVSPGFTIGDNPAATFKRNSWTLKDDLHWVKGNHTLAFGFQGDYSRVNLSNQFRQPGAFTFGSAGSGNAMANFLLGYLSSFNQQSGQFFENHGHFIGFFGQDSWKVNRNFSLNFGLRYEPFFPWHEVQNRMGAFDPAAFAAGVHSTQFPNAPIGLKFPGDPGMITDGIRSVYTDFMPRLGFAWDVFGDSRTSIRGGFGVFYDTRVSSVLNNIYSNGSPYVTTFGLTFTGIPRAGGTFSDPYSGNVNPFPAPQPPPANAPFPTQGYFSFDPFNEYQPTRFYNWNLAAEYQVTSASVARLAYVGSHGSHLWVPLELNYTKYNSVTGGASSRLYAPVYTQPISTYDYGGNSNYNSLQVSFEQRFHRGFSVLANYTWSKALDNLPPGASVTAVASNVSYVMPIYEPNFRQMDDGPSDFDRTHVFSLSYVWELPKVSYGFGPARYILNGWQTNGILQLRSGDPITILSGASDNSKSAQLRDRAVQVGNPYGAGACGSTPRCVDYLNPAAFTTNAVGTYGSAGKGAVRGPGFETWDVSLMRHIRLNERMDLEFRAEYFNVLNRPNFNDPASNNQAPFTGAGTAFGRITGAQDPRIGQLSLKLHF